MNRNKVVHLAGLVTAVTDSKEEAFAVAMGVLRGVGVIPATMRTLVRRRDGDEPQQHYLDEDGFVLLLANLHRIESGPGTHTIESRTGGRGNWNPEPGDYYDALGTIGLDFRMSATLPDDEGEPEEEEEEEELDSIDDDELNSVPESAEESGPVLAHPDASDETIRRHVDDFPPIRPLIERANQVTWSPTTAPRVYRTYIPRIEEGE